MPAMDDAVSEFLVESHENLNQLDRDLVALESDPGATEVLARVFRTIHTIKGTCGFLGYTRLEAVSHSGESLLSDLRDRTLPFSRTIADALLAMVDAIRRMLLAIETTRSDGEEDHSSLIARLDRLRSSEPAADVGRGTAPSPAGPGSVAAGSIRVDVGLLDRLMNLVGELVLTRNQILQMTASRREPALAFASQRLSLITSELQEGIMKTRMQPISNLWSRIPRQVRDLAASCGKRVRVEMDGLETELDRGILEAIRDPLTHLVRNAVDHGIESPEARAAAGKPVEGRIDLGAFHEGGQVHILISDDGGGIDPVRVREEAIRRGLIDPSEAERLGERETMSLLFMPGFSTAARVTSVSGRGVGMDVVRTNVERLGGSVEIRSEVGRGSRIEITLPLTLAIIPALVVACRGERYALPQTSLLELVRIEEGGGDRGIERLHGVPVYRLRGALLPLVDLGGELAGSGRSARSRRAGGDEAVHIVVLHVEDRTFGLVVDGIDDTQEIVVKPLGRHLKKIPVFAGATILGDGRVALILDVTGLAARAGVAAEGQSRAAVLHRHEGGAPDAVAPEVRTLLLFDAGGGGRMAVPLSSVARLEEFPRAAVETVGSREVVQYRSSILPLVRISDLCGHAPEAPGGTDPLQVVVYSDGGRSAGIVVDRIQDIVQEPVRIEGRGSSPGSAGTAVIQERVTEILDIPALLRRRAPAIFDPKADAEALVS